MLGHWYTLLFSGAAPAPATVAGASSSSVRRKKRYAVRLGGRLVLFGSQADALRAIASTETRKVPEIVEVEPPLETTAEPVEMAIELPQVKAYAKATGAIQQYNEAYNSRHYQALIALFEQMRDEEDVELLLMHA